MKSFLIFFVFLVLAINAKAADLFVAKYGNDGNDGLSWANAKSNLQSVVQGISTSQQTVVNVGAGTWQMTNLNLFVPTNVIVRGTNREEVVLIAALTNRCVFLSPSASVESLSITGGSTSLPGAGVYGSGYLSSIVSNCLIFLNTCGNNGGGGNGIFLVDSEVYSNSAANGGGLYAGISSNSVIRNNVATRDGGGTVFCNIYNSQILNNRASRFGGGGFSSNIYSSIIVSNFSTNNGGGFGYIGQAFDSIFSYNISSNNGGGIYSATVVSNCIFEYNSAILGGGVNTATEINSSSFSNNIAVGTAAMLTGAGAAYSITLVTNCIFVGNSAKNGGAIILAEAYNCIFSNNYATVGGGAAYRCRIYDSVISSNSAEGGGGTYNSLASNCVFRKNSATGSWSINEQAGGGSAFASTNINCLFEMNSAYWGGGSGSGWNYNCVFTSNSAVSGAAIRRGFEAFNCTVIGHTNQTPAIWMNANANIAANNISWNNASNAIAGTTNIFSNFTNNPLLMEGSWKLQITSECIDAGNDTFAIFVDFYGRTRINGLHVDIGAAEWYAEDVPVTGGSERKKMLEAFWRIENE